MNLLWSNPVVSRLTLALLLSAEAAFSAPVEIGLVYPEDESIIQAGPSDSSFVFGRVEPANASLTINGRNVEVFDNGAFIAYLPIKPGHFTFNCVARSGADSVVLDRTVFVPSILQTSSDSLIIEDELMFPAQKVELHQGDLLRVRFKGTPGRRAYFSIDGVREFIPMAETDSPKYPYWGEQVFGDKPSYVVKNVRGIYEGSYLVQPLDWRENRKIYFYLISSTGDTLTQAAPYPVTIFDNSFPQTGEIKSPNATLRTGIEAGYYYFLPKGTKIEIDGRYGPYLKVRLSDYEEAWIAENEVDLLPPGSPPPLRKVNVIRVRDIGKVRVTVVIGERIPFRIEQQSDPQQLIVRMYGIISDTDWVRYESGSDLVKDIRWQQVASSVYQLNISLAEKQQWGYNADYDENDNFILDINKPPRIAGWPSSPLKHISILLDPGHSPDTGAVGPTGTTEAEQNYKLALVLEKKLRAKGAAVYMTRRGEYGITLGARKKLAEMLGADILLSLHHNALPDGVNPFRNRGTSTYYYHPQSYPLAALIQKKLLEKLHLKNFGLYYDNLAMARPTQMPAVLIEPAFLMHPEEEQLINSQEYREKCSSAIIEALEEFLENSKE